MMSKRFCVFCGGELQDKTKEHVLPRWLIELTGDPKRLIRIGPFVSQHVFHKKEEIEDWFKEFSFDSLCFPACRECNERFGKLEELVKPVVVGLLAGEPISAYDFDLLLDWFDKVRVGLWLGYHHFFDENYWGVRPHFYIADRIGLADRALLIYQAAYDFAGLSFIGVNTPAFAHAPSCFTLVIDKFLLMNVSHNFLLAERAGLPYPESMELAADETLQVTLVPGTGVVATPLFAFSYDERCTVIAQPVFAESAVLSHFPEFAEFYDSDYVQRIALGPDRAAPLLQKGDSVVLLPRDGTSDWIPACDYDADGILERMYIQTLRVQNYVVDRVPVSKDMVEERRQHMMYALEQCVKANNHLISQAVDYLLLPSGGRRKIPRNSPCPCGSGKKYKHCCGKHWGVGQ